MPDLENMSDDEKREYLRLLRRREELSAQQDFNSVGSRIKRDAQGFGMGVADIGYGAAQLGLNLAEKVTDRAAPAAEAVNNRINQRENERWEQRTGDPILANGTEPGFDFPRLAGNVTAGVATTGKLPPAATPVGRVGQNMGVGGLFGIAQPIPGSNNTLDDFWLAKAQQLMLGTAAGGAVTGGIEGVKAGVRAMTPQAPASAAVDVLRAATGNADDVLQNLDSGMTPQRAIANTPEVTLAGLERNTRGRSTAAANTAYAAEREAAVQRASSLRNILNLGKDDSIEDFIDEAVEVRTNQTKPLFARAEQSQAPVNPQNTLSKVQQLLDTQPEGDTALKKLLQDYQTSLRVVDKEVVPAPTHIRDITARSRGESSLNLGERTRTSSRLESRSDRLINLYKKIAADIDARGPNGARVNEPIVRELTEIRKQLAADIGEVNKDFITANTEFQRLSIPVNRGKVLSELDNALSNPLGDVAGDAAAQQRALPFANSMRNDSSTVAKAGGFKRNKGLSEIFNEDELGMLDNIAKELNDMQTLQKMSTKGNPAAKRALEENTRQPELPNLLNNMVTTTNQFLRRAGMANREDTADMVGEIFADPEKFRQIMERLSSQDRQSFRVFVRNTGAALNEMQQRGVMMASPAIQAAMNIERNEERRDQ